MKNTLIRIEHFGILILTLDGRRFTVSHKYETLLGHIQGMTFEEILASSQDFPRNRLLEFLNSLRERGIITVSDKKIITEVKIIKNKYISKDCLSFPRTVYWELGQRCNIQCIHCYSDSDYKGFSGLKFEIIKKTLDELIFYGVEFLNIGGGEPFMYQDIFKLLEYCINNGLMLEITTNGTLLNEEMIKRLATIGVKYIQISLDGSNKELYERIRIKANFDKVIENIKLFIKYGIVVSVNTVLMQLNKNDVINIIDLCRLLGVSYYKVSPLMETGRGTMIDLQLSPSELRNIYSEILVYKEKYKSKMNIIFYQNILLPEIKNIPWMPDCHYGCPAGRTTCGIDSKGNVYPCSYMNHKTLICGNIKENSLAKIWATSKVLDSLRRISSLEGVCGSCKFLQKCRGGCRAIAYLRNGKINSSDPLCVVEK